MGGIKHNLSSALKINIRPMQWTDSELGQMLEIEALCFNRYDAYTLEDFRRWFGYNPDLCLVAEIDRQVAGNIISRILKDKAALASMAIHPDYRRHGIGEALLDETIRRVKTYHVGCIDLEVRETNIIGRRFWEKMEFLVIGSQPGFYEDGETALLMRKTII